MRSPRLCRRAIPTPFPQATTTAAARFPAWRAAAITKLQSKTVAPTKAQQAITPDSGYYGLSDVTVSQIPDAYQDVSSVTAGAADTLTGKVIVTADGKVATGTMPNNGAVSKMLDAGTPSYTIPKGYHSGAGKVSVAVETKTVTPTKAAQDIVPSTGKVLTKVSVAAIPDAFADTSGADALAANILDGKTAFVNGVKVTGSMPDNGQRDCHNGRSDHDQCDHSGRLHIRRYGVADCGY